MMSLIKDEGEVIDQKALEVKETTFKYCLLRAMMSASKQVLIIHKNSKSWDLNTFLCKSKAFNG